MIKTLDEIKGKESTIYHLIIVILLSERMLFGYLDANQYKIIQIVMMFSIIFGVLAGLKVKNRIKPIIILSVLIVLTIIFTLLILSVQNGHFYNFHVYFGSAVLSLLIFIAISTGVSFIKNEHCLSKQPSED